MNLINQNNSSQKNLAEVENVFNILLEKMNTYVANLAVIGLGYVGLPLVFALYKKFKVIGFDIDENKINSLKNNKSYIKNFSDQEIIDLNTSNNFQATNDINILKQADIILICVPTPLTKNRDPDLSYIISTGKLIGKILNPGKLIVLESTTYPGTTQEVLKPILENKSNLLAGKDFFLGYAPEREDPGNKKFSAVNIPKVIGADDEKSKLLLIKLYSNIAPEVVPVNSTQTAEAVKILENIFRCVNIALINELKVVFDKMNINIWEVIEAAKTKPFGFMPFYPSPGLGGHCIPIDPFYLTWKAKEYDVFTKFIELAGEINSSMPDYVINKLKNALDDRFAKALNGSKILIIGVAYKKNVDDIRESPSLHIFKKLIDKKAEVDYFDPYVNFIPNNREFPELSHIYSIKLTKENLKLYDVAIICTDHDNINYQLLVEHSKLIVDTRNATSIINNNELKITNIVYA